MKQSGRDKTVIPFIEFCYIQKVNISFYNYLYQLGIKNSDTSNTPKNMNNKKVTIKDAEPIIKPVLPNPLSCFFIATIPNTIAKIADITEQKLENDDVILDTSELIEVNKDKMLANTTGILAIVIVETIVK